MSQQITNALIESTTLGMEGHGIMTWYLNLKFPPGEARAFNHIAHLETGKGQKAAA